MIVRDDGSIIETENANLSVYTDNYDSGGAGLLGTVDDYMKFAQTLANGGVSAKGIRIIDERYLEMMRSDCLPLSAKGTFSCVQGEGYSYGFGVRVRTKSTDWGLLKGEFGWDGRAGSYLMVDPHKRISVVIGMHLLNWPIIFLNEHLNIVKEIYKNIILT